MKSRTLSCDKTVLKKDITRFMPLWALYTIFLLVLLVVCRTDGNGGDYYFVRSVNSAIEATGVVNLGYAFLCALLLFGDLHNTRLCNALHALPIPRESWFVTHVAAGMLFSLVPNLLFTLIVTPMLGAHFITGLIWLLVVSLEFVCFFGIAIFSVMCVGNRFASAVMYCVVNFLVLLVAAVIEFVYKPLLTGVTMNLDWANWGMPIAAVMNKEYLIMDSQYIEGIGQKLYGVAAGSELWIPLVYALVGISFAAGALVLYRRRKLETAGDFLAFSAMEKPFLVLFTICAGCLCHIFFVEMVGLRNDMYLFLVVGIVVGYFACQMLLKRTIKVFRLRAFVEMALISGVLLLSLLITWLDPLGITRWVPNLQEVKAVTVYNSYEVGRNYDWHFTLEEPWEIQQILDIHAGLIAENANGDQVNFVETTPAYETITMEEKGNMVLETVEVGSYMNIVFEYALANGRTVTRYYRVYSISQDGRTLQTFFTRPECVFFRANVWDIAKLPESVVQIRVINNSSEVLVGEEAEQMVRAILADCEAGTMAQPWEYHEMESTQYWLDVEYRDHGGYYQSIRIYESTVHSYAYLQSLGIPSEKDLFG